MVEMTDVGKLCLTANTPSDVVAGRHHWVEYALGYVVTEREMERQRADNLRTTRASRIQRHRRVGLRLRAKRFHAGA